MTTELYQHQLLGVRFLAERKSAMLCDEMGLGKTRQALVAAQELFRDGKINRVLVLAPAAVRYSWHEEINKTFDATLTAQFIPCIYEPKKQFIYGARIEQSETKVPWSFASKNDVPILIVSYALLPQKRHVEALKKWCSDSKALLVCDESSFLKNRTAKQVKSAIEIANVSKFAMSEFRLGTFSRWLLTGTPIANSPLDLWGQGLVMFGGPDRGALKGFKNFYQFRARYAVLKQMNMGQVRFQRVVGYQNLDELTKRFAPYVLRRTKAECLDLPAKSYTVREIALSEETWRIYQELRKEALLALPDEDVRPEPNAAVRIARLRQLTSGYAGTLWQEEGREPTDGAPLASTPNNYRDISSEKLDWFCNALLDGELQSEQAVIVWCAWRRERERLQQMLATQLEVYGVYGGQQDKNRSFNVQSFQTSQKRRVLVAQQHAGGYGLTLTAASTCVYLSNTFSHVDRVQSEDRVHRVGQENPCLYVDVLAVGPRGQRTVDAHVFEALRAKKDLAAMTCKAWRRALND